MSKCEVIFHICVLGCIGLFMCGTESEVPSKINDNSDTLSTSPTDTNTHHDSINAQASVVISLHEGDTLLDTLKTDVKVIGWDSTMYISTQIFNSSDTAAVYSSGRELDRKDPAIITADTALFKLYRNIQSEGGKHRLTVRVLKRRRYLDTILIRTSYDATQVPVRDSIYTWKADTVVQKSVNIYLRPLVLSVKDWNHGDVYKIVEDSSGIVWLMTALGLYFFDGKRFAHAIERIPGLAGIQSRKIAVDPSGNLWVDSVGEWTTSGCPSKIIVWQGSKRIATYSFPLVSECNADMGFDKKGSFFALLPGSYSGFVQFENDSMVCKYFEQCNGESLVYSKSRCRFLFDNYNRLWITTMAGVALMSGEECGFFDSSNTDWPGRTANGIKSGRDGTIYVQFDTHIASYNGTWHTVIKKDQGEYEGLDVDSAGNLWVLQYLKGPIVVKIRDGQVVRGFGNSHTYSGDVHVCRDGTVVAGGAGAILFIREKGFSPDTHL